MIAKELDYKELLQERERLCIEKQEIVKNIQSLGISKNRVRYADHTVAAEDLGLRKAWAKRYTEIETRLFEIKGHLKDNRYILFSDEHIIREIIQESFGRDYYYRLKNEITRRRKGEAPLKVMPDQKNYKRELLNAYDTLIEARKAINEYIAANEPEINKGDYLKGVSGINTIIPPLSFINKMKREVK